MCNVLLFQYLYLWTKIQDKERKHQKYNQTKPNQNKNKNSEHFIIKINKDKKRTYKNDREYIKLSECVRVMKGDFSGKRNEREVEKERE